MLRSLEEKIAGLVEGAFGRAFKSEVRPVEIARKLAREMDEHKSVSLSRTYVPNEYAVYLSPEDRDRFAGYEDALAQELTAYLLEHSRAERFALLSRPQISFRTDERLTLGEFGIQARLVQPEGAGEDVVGQGETGQTMIYSTRGGADRTATATGGRALLLFDGRRVRVPTGGLVLGRSREADLVVRDANVSRRHAEIAQQGATWTIKDLGSTNGVLINGHKIGGAEPLQAGDAITLGTSELRFELE